VGRRRRAPCHLDHRPALSHRTAHVACAVVARRERVALHDATRLQGWRLLEEKRVVGSGHRRAGAEGTKASLRRQKLLAVVIDIVDRLAPGARISARARRAARGLLSMDMRRHAAARNGLAAMTVALLIQATPALADGAPNLILPLVTAIAFASAASNVPRQVATLDPGGRPLLSLIPQQVHLVDGYQYDFESYVGLRRPNDMVDSDRVVSYDILRRPRRGWMAFVAYDEEYRGPVTGRSEVLRLELKHRF